MASSPDVSAVTSNSSVINMENSSSNDSLPKGKYTLVGIDIDTTGRRLTDEIVQLAAYTPTDKFSQYIMPYQNLNPAARQRHQVRVVSIGFYRMLKSNYTFKVIKSKSEIAAFKDFLKWLEEVQKADAESEGIILLYHEERKFLPYMILVALQKYNLLDRFLTIVKSFVNGLLLAKDSIDEPIEGNYSIRKLSKLLELKNFGKEESEEESRQAGRVRYNQTVFEGNASVRARLAFQIAEKLSNQDKENREEVVNSTTIMHDVILRYASKPTVELNQIGEENENLTRQHTYRPVFLHYFKTTITQRVRAVKFRIQLASMGYTLQSFKKAWENNQKQGIIELLEPITDLKDADKTELAELFDSYFDPEKTILNPPPKLSIGRKTDSQGDGNDESPVDEVRGKNETRGHRTRRTFRSRRHIAMGNVNGTEHGAGGDKESNVDLPDSTSKSPRHKSYTPRRRPSSDKDRQTSSHHSNSVPRRTKAGRRNPRYRNNVMRPRYPQNSRSRKTVVASN